MDDTPPTEKVDLCAGACFGRQKIRRSRGGRKKSSAFVGSCTELCRLHNECLSKSLQEYEEKISSEKELKLISNVGIRTKENFHYPDDNITSGDAILSETLGDFVITPESRSVLFEFVRRIWELYRLRPVLFDVMMRRLFAGENVSDIAKSKGVSRQYISSSLAREVTGMQPGKSDPRDLLSGLELAVYNICFEDGCTIRSAAKQLGISKDKVLRLRQKISTKISKTATRQRKKVKK